MLLICVAYQDLSRVLSGTKATESPELQAMPGHALTIAGRVPMMGLLSVDNLGSGKC